MKNLRRLCAALLLSISFFLIAVSQEGNSQSNGTQPKNGEDFVDIEIPLKNANAYYCRSDDLLYGCGLLQFSPEFMEVAKTNLFPLLSGKDGWLEFELQEHLVRLRLPGKNIDAARQFWKEQERAKPDASEEDRKKGVTKICPQASTRNIQPPIA